MADTYNGWSNYATWNVKLWIDNDGYCGGADGVAEAAEDIAKRSDGKDSAVEALATYLEGEFDCYVDELNLKGPFADIFMHAWASVDWREIAQSFVDDVDDALFAEGSDDAEAALGTSEAQPENNMLLARAKNGLSVYRCRACDCRWLFWIGEIVGMKPGVYSLLDQYQRPGACCDNVPMGDQMEWLRDVIAPENATD